MASDVARRLGRLLGGPVRLFDSASGVREHDLLVRARAAEALGAASTVLRDLAARYREERIGPQTREQPFPPAERMAALRRLDAAQRSLSDLASRLRSAELPPQDAVFERLRSAALQYELMLEADLGLLEPCERCIAAARALDLAAAEGDGLAPLEAATREVERAARERSTLLAAPAL